MKNGHPIPKEESSRAHGNSNTAAMTVTDPLFKFHGELVKTFDPLDLLPIPDGKVGTWSSRRAANHEKAQLIARRKEQVRQQLEAEQYLRQLKAAGHQPNEKVSKPLFTGHSILIQRISLAHELGRSYLENTSDYLASVHSPLED